MFNPPDQDASASTLSPAASLIISPNSDHETARHMLFGSLSAVQSTIAHLHKLRYAEPNDWSKPIATGRPNEVAAILTKRVKTGQVGLAH